MFINVCLRDGTNDLFVNVCLQDGTTDVTRTLHFGTPTEYENIFPNDNFPSGNFPMKKKWPLPKCTFSQVKISLNDLLPGYHES